MDPSRYKLPLQPNPTPTPSTTLPPSNPPAYTPHAVLSTLPTTHPLPIPDDPEDELASPLTINLHTPLKIVGHQNYISPSIAQSATELTAAVMAALQGSMLTMDEDGRSRPITLNIVAGVSLVGSRNVLGGKEPGPEAGKVGKGRVEGLRSEGRGRKRRAESEPADCARVKRQHFGV